MEPRISFVTLGVTDLERSTRFYGDGLRLPRLASPPKASFFDLGPTRLALYPRALLAADAGVSPAGSGFSGFALAHNVGTAQEVDRLLEQALAAGGRVVRSARHTDWGGYAGYFADPDSFLWEIAWNPRFLEP
jgi:catechol 2,3-dioxygenase-like lactoylglutathione lyase family enzyme